MWNGWVACLYTICLRGSIRVDRYNDHIMRRVYEISDNLAFIFPSCELQTPAYCGPLRVNYFDGPLYWLGYTYCLWITSHLVP